MQIIQNTSKREITLTLRVGEIAQPGIRAVESVKVTIGPSSDKPLEGRAPSKLILKEVCAKHGLDLDEVSARLSKSGFVEQMIAQGILAVA